MTFIKVGDQQIEVDDQGFLVDPFIWNEDIANAIALRESISQLTEEHWKIIRYFRDYYSQHSTLPAISRVCKEHGISLKRVYELFPSGPSRGACKIAGLPRPRGCV